MRNAAQLSVNGCRTSRIIRASRGGGFGRSNTASAAPRYGQDSQVLESGDSMVRIVIGIILFLIGLGTFLSSQSSPDGGVIWTGGMIVGAIVAFSGFRSLSRR